MYVLQQYKSQFYHLGENIVCKEGIVIEGIDKMSIGDNVKLMPNVTLLVNPYFENDKQDVKVSIGDRSFVGRNVIIESFNQVVVEEDVLIGPRVYISDSQHTYSNPQLPIHYQPSKSMSNRLVVKRGGWIGTGAVLVGGITIGYGSVIGANSVVTSDVPSHCVVFGNPSTVLRIYHYKEQRWINPTSEDEFIQILQERGEFLGYDDKIILEHMQSQLKEIKETSK